jgi:hypothetical protein
VVIRSPISIFTISSASFYAWIFRILLLFLAIPEMNAVLLGHDRCGACRGSAQPCRTRTRCTDPLYHSKVEVQRQQRPKNRTTTVRLNYLQDVPTTIPPSRLAAYWPAAANSGFPLHTPTTPGAHRRTASSYRSCGQCLQQGEASSESSRGSYKWSVERTWLMCRI